MKKQRNQSKGMSKAVGAMLPLLAFPLLFVSGCDKAATNKPPTTDQAKAFKGAPMTAEERAGMVKEQQDAAAYRRAHPNEFPNEPPAPK